MARSGDESEHGCEVSGCVLVSVPNVTDLISPASVASDVVFSDSDCELGTPQIFSLSRQREASVALECETEMKSEGPPVKAVSETVRRRPTPQGSL